MTLDTAQPLRRVARRRCAQPRTARLRASIPYVAGSGIAVTVKLSMPCTSGPNIASTLSRTSVTLLNSASTGPPRTCGLKDLRPLVAASHGLAHVGRPGLRPQVCEDLLHHRLFEDCRSALLLGDSHRATKLRSSATPDGSTLRISVIVATSVAVCLVDVHLLSPNAGLVGSR